MHSKLVLYYFHNLYKGKYSPTWKGLKILSCNSSPNKDEGRKRNQKDTELEIRQLLS